MIGLSMKKFHSDFSRSHWHCHPSVCQSVCLSWLLWVLWLNDTSYRAKVSEQMNRKCAARTRFFTTFNPLSSPFTLKLFIPEFKNFACLLYLAFLITCSFCLRCYEHGRVVLSRWSLITASYAVRSAISATAGLLVARASNDACCYTGK